MIVQLGKFFRPDIGGIESVTEDLLNWCRNNEIETKIVCFSNSNEYSKRTYTEEPHDSIVRCRYRSIGSQPLSVKYFLMGLRWGTRSNMVLVHCPNFLGLVVAICVKLIRPSVKIVGFWHSDVIGKGLSYYLLIPIERIFLWLCSRVVCTSPKYPENSKALTGLSAKISVVPLTVNDSFLEALGNRPVELNQLRDEGFFLSIGRNVGYKNYELLISSFTRSGSKSHLVICGSGLASLKKFVGADGEVASRILLLEAVPEAEKRWLQENADALILASTTRDEAFGVVLIEALAVGTPIVSFDIPGSGVGWVNDGNAGILLENCDWEGLGKILSNRCDIRERFDKELVKSQYRKRFSQSIMFENLNKALLPLLSSK